MMRFGFIGSGSHGSAIIKQALGLSLPISCVYGHANRAELESSVDFVDSVEEVIANSDAVIVNTPPDVTAAIGMMCIDAGKPCLLSKPVGISAEQVVALLESSRNKSIPVMAGHSLCYSNNLHEYLLSQYQAAFVHHRRPPSSGKMNIYWNIGIHFVALFDVLGIDNYAIELLMCHGIETAMYIKLLSQGSWREMEITGSLFTSELLHFYDCLHNGDRFLTNIEHAYRVITTLEERYGSIDILKG